LKLSECCLSLLACSGNHFPSHCRRQALLDELLAEGGADSLGLERVRELPGCEGSAFWWCFTFTPSLLTASPERVYQALCAEGVKCEHGYPSARTQLYDYDVLRHRKTFGGSAFPLTSPPARREWEYPPGLCPVSEAVCPRTICLHWSENFTSEHVQLIGSAILKVLRAYQK
jgi:perosamine synthetase